MAERKEMDDYLLISGIQHFAFCRRQWGLIHIEHQWQENVHTVEGDILHERAHNAKLNEKRGDLLICREMPVYSNSLMVTGRCDVVEFHRDDNGVALHGRKELWLPLPIEYKKGRPKAHNADELQLCCQAMCLEEMLMCDKIPLGYLYYGETAHRTEVIFSDDLRERVAEITKEMQAYYDRQHTPKSKPGKQCSACSMKDICLPKLYHKKSVAAYMAQHLESDA